MLEERQSKECRIYIALRYIQFNEIYCRRLYAKVMFRAPTDTIRYVSHSKEV